MSLPDEIYAELCRQADAPDGWSPYVGEKDFPDGPSVTVDGYIDLEQIALAILTGPTLTAVRGALRAVMSDMQHHLRREGVIDHALIRKAALEKVGAAVKLLEGE